METYRSAIFSFGASALMTKKCCILTKYHVSVDKKILHILYCSLQSVICPSLRIHLTRLVALWASQFRLYKIID